MDRREDSLDRGIVPLTIRLSREKSSFINPASGKYSAFVDTEVSN